MNDNARRAPQWQRLVGEYLSPRLGGQPQEWAQANRMVAGRLFEGWDERVARAGAQTYEDLWGDYQERWLREMCAEVGATPPESRITCLEIAGAAAAYVTPRVRAAFPRVIETIRTLHEAGFRLYTASGENSDALAGYMNGMEVLGCFTTLYGPDIVGKAKAGAFYYERIFTHAGIAPAAATVVDDKEICLNWAAETGAKTVLCSRSRPATSRHRHIYRLSQLPGIL